MAFSKNLKIFSIVFVLLSTNEFLANLSNLVPNDPYPFYSTFYPYFFMTKKQKENIQLSEWAYAVDWFRLSISPFRQSANNGVNNNGNYVNIPNLNGGIYMLGLFYDPLTAQNLFNLIGLKPESGTCSTPPAEPTEGIGFPIIGSNPAKVDCYCYDIVTNPSLIDPNGEFGFYQVPVQYRKYGVRAELEAVLFDGCFDSICLKMQFGVVSVQQRNICFEDMTPQACGVTCPACNTCNSPTEPVPQTPVGITPPFITTTKTNSTVPTTSCAVVGTSSNCIPVQQTFKSCADTCVSFGYTPDCKQTVENYIMNEASRQSIFKYLGINAQDYNQIGLEDIRVYLNWRHLFVINETAEKFPKVLVMPFLEGGAGLPMAEQIPGSRLFAVPISNNGHASLGATGGLTIDFPDTINLNFSFGFTYFFKSNFNNFRLPNALNQFGVFPYTADVTIQPGINWQFGAGMLAYHFLDNLSFWFEYVIIDHSKNCITINSANVPFGAGSLDARSIQDFSKWQTQFANSALNYDISDAIEIGLLWQAPAVIMNAYRSGTIMGSISILF